MESLEFFHVVGNSESKFGLDKLAILPWWCEIANLGMLTWQHKLDNWAMLIL
jgi:hypothetical protein